MGSTSSSEQPPKYEAFKSSVVPVGIQANNATLYLPVPPENCFRAEDWPELTAALGEARVKGMTVHRMYGKSKASPIARVEVRAHKEYWTFREQELEKIEALSQARQRYAMSGAVVTYVRTNELYDEAVEVFREKYFY